MHQALLHSHDSVDAGELSQEDHHVRIDDCSPSSWLRDKVKPRESPGSSTGSNFSGFFLCANFHQKEFLSRLDVSDTADSLPDLVGIKGAAFVHQKARRFWHVEHSYQHDGRE